MHLHGTPVDIFFYLFLGQAAGVLALLGVLFQLVWRWGARRFQGSRIPTRRPADARQIRRELVHTLVTLAVGAANATLVVLLYQAGYTKLSTDPSAWSLPALVLSVIGSLVVVDGWLYCWHRLLHHPRLFPWVHAVHHRSIDVNPFTSYSFHAVEAFFISAWVVPMVMLVPLYIPAFAIAQAIGTAINIMSHLGYEFVPRWQVRLPVLRWISTATYHSLHHTHVKGNYGLFFRFWDRILRTEVPGYQRAFLERGPRQPRQG